MAEQTTQQEQQKLQKGKSYITVVGKAKVTDTTFSGEKTSNSSDYFYKRLNLGIETAEGNIVYGEQMGGNSPTKNYKIKVRTKPVDGKQGERVEIDWADRLNESIVESIGDFDVFKVGLIREGDEPAEGAEDKRKLVVKKFLSSYDAHDYIQQHLKDGMMIMAKGKYAFRKNQEDDKKVFQIKDIFLSKSEEGFANFVQTVVIDSDSISKDAVKASKETGEIVISAMAVDYVSKINNKPVGKNMTFNLPITVRINKENPEITATILDKLFKVKKGKVREITIEGQIFEGFEQQQVSKKDVKMSKDVQELIAMGLYSEEEAMEKMTVRGNKVSKLVFTRPFILKDKDDATKIKMDFSDDKYVPEDLIVVIPEDEDTSDMGEEIDLNKMAEEKSNDQGDAWLKGLGLGN